MNKTQKKINTHKPQFDLNTHVRDNKGNIVNNNPYRLTIINGVKEYERPPGSGYIYDEAGGLKRSPKHQPEVEAKKEFSNDSLAQQMEDLREKLAVAEAKLAAAQVPAEINMTANDIIVDDIVAVPVGQADNSEEILLMEQAGATVEATALKAASKPLFNKPNFLK